MFRSRLLSRVAVVAGFGLASVVSTHPTTASVPDARVAAAKPPEFSGTITVDFDYAYRYAGTLNGTASARYVITLDRGDTGLDGLGGSVTEFSGQEGTTGGFAECNSTLVYTDAPTPWPYGPEARPFLMAPEISKDIYGGYWHAALPIDVQAWRVSDSCRPADPPAYRLMYAFDRLRHFALTFDLANEVDGGRRRLVAHEHIGLDNPDLVDSEAACDSAADTYCFDSLRFDMTYDLTRIDPASPFAQYPTLRVANDSLGRDVITVKTHPAVAHRGLWVNVVTNHGSLKHVTLGAKTDKNGVYRLVLKDPKPSKATRYMAEVSPTLKSVTGYTISKVLK